MSISVEYGQVITGVRFARQRAIADLSLDRILALGMLAVAVVMIVCGLYGLAHAQSDGGALITFACIGGGSTVGGWSRQSWPAGPERIAAHLSRMGGTGIATVTAVFVVNAGDHVRREMLVCNYVSQ